MTKAHEEWLKQSAYDLDTAEFMFRGGRNFYAMFMCHLSVEKALKGLRHAKLGEVPPKTHNLIFLLTRCGCTPPESVGQLLTTLNESSVTTRYPADIDALTDNYTKELVSRAVAQVKDTLAWIRQQF